MGDFLSRLAGRTLGVESVAQPIIAPLFAAGPTMVRSEPALEVLDVVDEVQAPVSQQRRRTTPTPAEPPAPPTTSTNLPQLPATPLRSLSNIPEPKHSHPEALPQGVTLSPERRQFPLPPAPNNEMVTATSFSHETNENSANPGENPSYSRELGRIDNTGREDNIDREDNVLGVNETRQSSSDHPSEQVLEVHHPDRPEPVYEQTSEVRHSDMPVPQEIYTDVQSLNKPLVNMPLTRRQEATSGVSSAGTDSINVASIQEVTVETRRVAGGDINSLPVKSEGNVGAARSAHQFIAPQEDSTQDITIETGVVETGDINTSPIKARKVEETGQTSSSSAQAGADKYAPLLKPQVHMEVAGHVAPELVEHTGVEVEHADAEHGYVEVARSAHQFIAPADSQRVSPHPRIVSTEPQQAHISPQPQGDRVAMQQELPLVKSANPHLVSNNSYTLFTEAEQVHTTSQERKDTATGQQDALLAKPTDPHLVSNNASHIGFTEAPQRHTTSQEQRDTVAVQQDIPLVKPVNSHHMSTSPDTAFTRSPQVHVTSQEGRHLLVAQQDVLGANPEGQQDVSVVNMEMRQQSGQERGSSIQQELLVPLRQPGFVVPVFQERKPRQQGNGMTIEVQSGDEMSGTVGEREHRTVAQQSKEQVSSQQHKEVQRAETAVAPPTIHVTIGRIDVRAVPAPAPAPRGQANKSGPTLSLQDYLKQNKRGGS